MSGNLNFKIYMKVWMKQLCNCPEISIRSIYLVCRPFGVRFQVIVGTRKIYTMAASFNRKVETCICISWHLADLWRLNSQQINRQIYLSCQDNDLFSYKLLLSEEKIYILYLLNLGIFVYFYTELFFKGDQ